MVRIPIFDAAIYKSDEKGAPQEENSCGAPDFLLGPNTRPAAYSLQGYDHWVTVKPGQVYANRPLP